MLPRIIQSPGPATHGQCEALVAPRNIHEGYRRCRGTALNVREGIWVCLSHSSSRSLTVEAQPPLPHEVQLPTDYTPGPSSRPPCPECGHPAHGTEACSSPSIASAAGCDCGPCSYYIDLEQALPDDPDEEEVLLLDYPPTMSCSLLEGHEGPHQLKVDA